MIMNKEQLLKAIKGHRLYKLYHSPTNEIPREELQGEVNPSGEATARLFDLKRRLRDIVKRQTDFPHKLVRDNDELQQLIQSVIVTLYSEGDGRVDNAGFKKFFDPLAGMTEGLIASMHSDDPAMMQDMRLMKVECKHKAFMQQLKKIVESKSVNVTKLGKALSSMLTHVFILGERTGGVNESLVSRLTGMVESLKDVENSPNVIAQVKAWGLFEAGEKVTLHIDSADNPDAPRGRGKGKSRKVFDSEEAAVTYARRIQDSREFGEHTLIDMELSGGEWKHVAPNGRVFTGRSVESVQENSKGMAPVTSTPMPKSQDKKLSGLDSKSKDVDTTTKGQPTGDETWDGKKDGKGAKADEKPNLLTQAPGNPEDGEEGEDAEQEVGGLDKGLPKAIDGQKLEPDDKKLPATKESVELKIVSESAAKVKYAIMAGGKQIGEATLNRLSRLGKLKGKLDGEKVFEARSPTHARQVVRQLLTA